MRVTEPPCLCRKALYAAPAQPSVAGPGASEFANYYPRVYRYAYLILLDYAAAEDVALRVMLRSEAGMDAYCDTARDELVFRWARIEIDSAARRRASRTRLLQQTGCLDSYGHGCTCPFGDRLDWQRGVKQEALHRWVLEHVEHMDPTTAVRVARASQSRRNLVGLWIRGGMEALNRLLVQHKRQDMTLEPQESRLEESRR
jgi:DNA-directed RNA polymerase specialized sigma24 family protein